MTTETENLWGELPTLTEQRLPRHLIAEQAAILSRATNNTLEGHVINVGNQPGMIHLRFVVRVPLLDNYVLNLFDAIHSLLTIYPVQVNAVETSLSGQCEDEAEFKEKVRAILQSPQTRKVIAALRLQSEAV